MLISSFRTNNKTHFCTRCLKHFNYERYVKDHQVFCSNKVIPENLIDDLKNSGGFWQEKRRLSDDRNIRYGNKLLAKRLAAEQKEEVLSKMPNI